MANSKTKKQPSESFRKKRIVIILALIVIVMVWVFLATMPRKEEKALRALDKEFKLPVPSSRRESIGYRNTAFTLVGSKTTTVSGYIEYEFETTLDTADVVNQLKEIGWDIQYRPTYAFKSSNVLLDVWNGDKNNLLCVIYEEYNSGGSVLRLMNKNDPIFCNTNS